MAKTAPAPAYDPEAGYSFGVTRPVKDGPFEHLPRDTITGTGALILRLIEQEGDDIVRDVQPL